MPPKRRKKPQGEVRKDLSIQIRATKEARKNLSIQIRATAEQKVILNEAATQLGLTLSGWMLSTCLQAAAALKKARESST